MPEIYTPRPGYAYREVRQRGHLHRAARATARWTVIPATKLTIKVVAVILAATAVGVATAARAVTVGRYRAHAAPVWVAVAAVTVRSWPVWAGVAVVAAATPRIHGWRAARAARRGRPAPRRHLSAREARLVATVAGGLGTWWAVAAGAGWRVLPVAVAVAVVAWPRLGHLPGGARAVATGSAGVVAFGLLVGADLVPAVAPWWTPALIPAAAAWPWWRGRRVARPVPPPAIVAAWTERITEGDPALVAALRGTQIVDFAGVKDTPGGPAGDAVLALPFGTLPSQVTTRDELAQHVLDMPAGSVQIGVDPTGSTRRVRVRFVPAGDSDRVRFFEEPSYDAKSGLFLSGYAHETAPSMAALNRPGGAMHWAAVAGTGGGKGGTSRLVVTEANLSERWLTVVLDGKYGAGLPSVRAGCGFYARTADEWRTAGHAVAEMLQARMDTYGLLGRDRWTPGPGEPGILLWCDEWKRIHETHPSLLALAQRITAEGRSLGVAFGAAMQKGDAYGWGNIEIRNNVYAGGTLWAGSAGDAAAAGVAAQSFGIDFTTIPGAPGWGAWLSQVDGRTAGEITRGLFLPSQSDVEDGAPAPFGRAEDWNEDAARQGVHRPTLQPALQAIFDRLVHGDPGLAADAQDAAQTVGREVQARTVDKILAFLAADDVAETGAQRAAIAEAVGGAPGWISQVLADAKTSGLVDQEKKFGPWAITPAGKERAMEVAA